ncbi:C40 family peptidase [Lactobacillus kefiranofaciens]|uniref:C40 family peptidase n=1 Tax=Lactobacillus kefiranofaciens TaxID=267818 RepID=UPI0006CF6989|nr:C40 family peptidase [Lactobacillus kefiranofaciens]KRL29177.1 cell wall-associated hydrolase [Lactobacillus kefiranofaciens subsp. kefirgranum DSM 10550 = JCM 8572]MCJ2173093.1 NlpC/P60 family protein [Lactobacillus kefiranofaciens]PAK97392.1 hydrolase [Lactobacillus kefiranofaciens]
MAKHKLFKLGAAAALTVTGVSALTSLKTVRAASFTAIKRVKINYLPGKSLNIWTNYNNGKFMGYRAKDGTIWNVAETAVDKKGNLWYKVGTREWIEARYTVDVDKDASAEAENAKQNKLANLASKVKKATKKKAKKPKKTSLTAAQQALKNAQAAEKKAKEDIAKAKAEAKAKKVKKAKQIVNTAVKKTKTKSVQASSKAASVVALAKEQVGKPYVWGAEGPDTFDCSGLVQYIYQHAAGVSMPRTTYDQVKVGQTVPLDQLQAGDLVFWGSETAPYHVAIYIGNNQYVNAATPEQGTILQTMSSYYKPTIAKRVL